MSEAEKIPQIDSLTVLARRPTDPSTTSVAATGGARSASAGAPGLMGFPIPSPHAHRNTDTIRRPPVRRPVDRIREVLM